MWVIGALSLTSSLIRSPSASRQVIAELNASLGLPLSWEGPGENDIVRLSNGQILSVFRVDSCQPYWTSTSDATGQHWSSPRPLGKPRDDGSIDGMGSVRPKLVLTPSGLVGA